MTTWTFPGGESSIPKSVLGTLSSVVGTEVEKLGGDPLTNAIATIQADTSGLSDTDPFWSSIVQRAEDAATQYGAANPPLAQQIHDYYAQASSGAEGLYAVAQAMFNASAATPGYAPAGTASLAAQMIALDQNPTVAGDEWVSGATGSIFNTLPAIIVASYAHEALVLYGATPAKAGNVLEHWTRNDVLPKIDLAIPWQDIPWPWLVRYGSSLDWSAISVAAQAAAVRMNYGARPAVTGWLNRPTTGSIPVPGVPSMQWKDLPFGVLANTDVPWYTLPWTAIAWTSLDMSGDGTKAVVDALTALRPSAQSPKPFPCPPGQVRAPNGECVVKIASGNAPSTSQGNGCPPGQMRAPNGLCVPLVSSSTGPILNTPLPGAIRLPAPTRQPSASGSNVSLTPGGTINVFAPSTSTAAAGAGTGTKKPAKLADTGSGAGWWLAGLAALGTVVVLATRKKKTR